jgi:hypothetical protein
MPAALTLLSKGSGCDFLIERCMRRAVQGRRENCGAYGRAKVHPAVRSFATGAGSGHAHSKKHAG